MPPIECSFIYLGNKTLSHAGSEESARQKKFITENFEVHLEHEKNGGVARILNTKVGNLLEIKLRTGSSIKTTEFILNATRSTDQKTLPSHQKPEK